MERKRGRRRIQPKQMDKIMAGLEARGVEFTRDGVGYAAGDLGRLPDLTCQCRRHTSLFQLESG